MDTTNSQQMNEGRGEAVGEGEGTLMVSLCIW